MSELQNILEKIPETKRLYEENSAFRMALDDINECCENARENLNDDDYLKFLRYSVAYVQEWNV